MTTTTAPSTPSDQPELPKEKLEECPSTNGRPPDDPPEMLTAKLEESTSLNGKIPDYRPDFIHQMLATEMQAFQKLLAAFVEVQHEHMNQHFQQVDRLLSGVPDRLECALHHPGHTPEATVRTQLRLPTQQPSSLAVAQGSSRSQSRLASKTSKCTNSSWDTPKMEGMLSMQQEYRQMKIRISDGGEHEGVFRSCCSAMGWKLRYYLPFSRFRSFVHSHLFGNLALSVIFLNLVFTAIVSDSEMKESIASARGQSAPVPKWFAAVDLVFVVMFTVELMLRLFAEELFFFCGDHWRWNLFDTAIVLSSAVDTLAHVSAPNLGFVRLIRLLRMLRSMKIMRIVRHFHELRIMVLQIMNSVKPMLWAFVFLGLVILMFALVFTQGVISYFEDLQTGRLGNDLGETFEEKAQDLDNLCGSFGLVVLSLFMSISGGLNWDSISRPLMKVSPLYVGLLVLYILVLMIGVLNIIVGIFVDSATNAAIKDREALALDELERNETLMKGLEDLFEELDKEKAGIITWRQFQEYTRRSEVRARFATLELDVSDAQEVFKLMDFNGHGFLAIDEFVVGIMRSKGLAKRTDIHSLAYQVQQMLKSIRQERAATTQRLDVIIQKYLSEKRPCKSHVVSL